jgi:hypothetical protein
MPATIAEAPGPASEASIAAAESALGVRFADDYRSFLRTANGGHPEPDAFAIQWQTGQPPADDWQSSSMSWFYGIDDPVRSANLVRVNTVTFRHRLPKDTFAFASDAGGNQLLFATDGPFAGKLLFWCKDHEATDGATPGFDNVGVVADSFEDFLERRLRSSR